TAPGAYAFRMYLNYDGAGSGFGNVSLHATSADQERLAVYAAQRTRDGALTVMVINKTTDDLTAPLSLTGPDRGNAAVYQYGQADPAAIVRLPDQPITGGGVTMTFPAYSMTQLIVPAR